MWSGSNSAAAVLRKNSDWNDFIWLELEMSRSLWVTSHSLQSICKTQDFLFVHNHKSVVIQVWFITVIDLHFVMLQKPKLLILMFDFSIPQKICAFSFMKDLYSKENTHSIYINMWKTNRCQTQFFFFHFLSPADVSMMEETSSNNPTHRLEEVYWG